MRFKSNENRYKSVSLSPFKYLRPSVRTEAGVTLGLLMAQVAMLLVTKSVPSLLIVMASLLASYSVDFINREGNYKDAFTVMVSSIRGILIGLLLPAGFPPAAVFFVSLFVLLINKYALGGFANSWVNPVAAAVAVCWITGMSFFPGADIPGPALHSRNIALSLIQDGTFPVGAADVAVTNWLNRRVFSLFGVAVPEGYVSLLWDSGSVIPAFRFNLLTLVSSVILLGTDVLSPIIPAAFAITYGVLVKALAPVFYGGAPMQGDVILAFLSSGTLFCTFFLLQWHGTTPLTNRGRWSFGISAGVLAFFVLGIGLSPAGFAFIILITNIISLFIQNVENHFLNEFTASALMQRVKAVREGNDA